MARKWAVNQTKRVKTPLVRENQDLELTIALIYNFFTVSLLLYEFPKVMEQISNASWKGKIQIGVCLIVSPSRTAHATNHHYC